MSDFAEYVLPNLLRVAIGVTAKGGKFFDERSKNEAQGKARVRRDNAADRRSIRICSMDSANLIELDWKTSYNTVQRLVENENGE